MMPVRYLALVAAPPSMAALRASIKAWSTSELETMYDIGPLWVAASAGAAMKLGENGLVIGTFFERGGTRFKGCVDRNVTGQITASRGQELIERYWGSYVAFLTDDARGTVDILRAPFGALPCFIVEIDGGFALASDMELLVSSGLYRPTIDWDAVLSHLMIRDLCRPQTCLTGVRELAGGRRLTVSDAGESFEEIWSPGKFAARDHQIDNPAIAPGMIEETARTSVTAAAAGHQGIMLMLSGGLDSSVVAACLARQKVAAHCITFVSGDVTGDERRYASQVCQALGLPLVKGWRDLSRIDVTSSDAQRLPRPSVRMFFQESRRLALEAAQGAGATAIFTGGGGDHVFCSLQSGAPAADQLKTYGPGRAFWRTAQDISRLAPASLWAVASDAVERAWLGKPSFRTLRDPMLLMDEAARSLPDREAHPWLQLPASTLPGKAQQIRLIALAQGIAEGGDATDAVPMLSPLLSQPLIEACLRIPSWSWFDGGHNRVVARRAFEEQLPPEILWRRSKGTPDAFTARIFDANRPKLGEMLAYGELAKRGVVDLSAVLAILDDPRPVHGDAFRRVLQFADVEAWANAWKAKG